jgi:hypothetical protein
MQQVAVCGVDFDDAKSCLACAHGGSPEIGDDACDACRVERKRRDIAVVKCKRARRKRRPTARIDCELPATTPRHVARGLASRMRELDARHRAVRARKRGDARPCVELRIVPQTRIGRRDASLRRHCARFRDDDTRAADGATAQMHGVPLVRHAIDRRVLAHRRHADAVAEDDIADRPVVEQMHVRPSRKEDR